MTALPGWAGVTRGPERTPGQNDGKLFRTCVECGQIEPAGIAPRVFQPGRVGHLPTCSLAPAETPGPPP